MFYSLEISEFIYNDSDNGDLYEKNGWTVKSFQNFKSKKEALQSIAHKNLVSPYEKNKNKKNSPILFYEIDSFNEDKDPEEEEQEFYESYDPITNSYISTVSELFCTLYTISEYKLGSKIIWGSSYDTYEPSMIKVCKPANLNPILSSQSFFFRENDEINGLLYYTKDLTIEEKMKFTIPIHSCYYPLNLKNSKKKVPKKQTKTNDTIHVSHKEICSYLLKLYTKLEREQRGYIHTANLNKVKECIESINSMDKRK